MTLDRCSSRSTLLLACLVALAAVGAARAVEPGDVAPPFTLDDLQGNPVTLADLLAGGPTVVAFFRTDCSHCQVELPLLQKLSREPAYAPLRFLAVDVREEAAVVAPFVAQHGVTFPVVLDTTMKVTRSYGVPSIPRAFFVKRDGTLNSSLGSAPEDVLREHLDNLVNEGAPTAQKVLVVVPSMDLESGTLTVEAARRAGYVPIVWNMAARGPIPEDELRKHLLRPVFRVVDQDLPGHRIEKPEDIAYMGLLSDGGKLILVGNDVAKAAGETEVLKYSVTTTYVADDAGSLQISGVAGDPDFSPFQFALREKTPNVGAVVPDLIRAGGNDATPVLRYAGVDGGCAALLVKT